MTKNTDTAPASEDGDVGVSLFTEEEMRNFVLGRRPNGAPVSDEVIRSLALNPTDAVRRICGLMDISDPVESSQAFWLRSAIVTLLPPDELDLAITPKE